jgi:Cys-rich protein (TIGR01571 family)
MFLSHLRAQKFLTDRFHSLTFLNRGQIRQNYAIKGDQVTDCLLSAFCGCCSIIQHEKEVLHKQAAGGIQQGYQAPVGMTTAPQ